MTQFVSIPVQDLVTDNTGFTFSLNPLTDKCGFAIPFKAEDLLGYIKDPSGKITRVHLQAIYEDGELARIDALLVPSVPGIHEVRHISFVCRSHILE